MNPDVTPYQMFLDVSVSTEKNQKNQGSVAELVIKLIILLALITFLIPNHITS